MTANGWPLVPMAEVLIHFTEYIERPEPREYPKLSVKLYGKGVILDSTADGSALKMQRHQIARAAAKIPLPPLDEQRRIVAKIDRLAGKIEEARSLRTRAAADVSALSTSLHASLSKNRRVRMDSLVELREERIPVDPSTEYPQVGLRGFGGGIFPKPPVSGADTTYRYFNKLKAGLLVLSQVKGWEGAIAVCPQELAGYFASPEYRTFRCLDRTCETRYLEYLHSFIVFPRFCEASLNGEVVVPRIQQLPHTVIAKIAAGEVIERPGSVVKEFLENAVDAGSTRIDVEVENGGTELIRVVDNGCGIVPEDLPLAFASHATSKLQNADDLFRIGTLGFRGEALASIGGVGQVTLQSRPADQPAGAEITCHGGTLSEVRPWNGSPGTRIEVRHLFFNTPVRRKFLRTTATEMGHLSEQFTRLALAKPGLQLALRHNGKRVYEVPSSAGLLDRIRLFFGAELHNQLYALEAHAGPIQLSGFIADPAAERGTAKMQYLFVNGRWVRDRSLSHALQEAYRGLLMTGRYAVAFLFLQLPPDQVDVNIHPTKAEVRFRDGNALYHLVLTAVRERLRKENLTARLRVPSSLGPSGAGPGYGDGPWTLTAPETPGPMLPLAPLSVPVPVPVPVPDVDEATSEDGVAHPANAESGTGTGTGTGTEIPFGSDAKVIQLYDAYLVLETPEGMLVIDQHALHERILFEQLKARIRTGPLETQRLLIPEPVDLPADQAARVLEHRAALAELGLEVDDFGGGTLLVTSYPAILGHRSPQAILKAVVDHLVTQDRAPSREQLFNDLLSLMACHAAVRAGDRLTPEQMAALVAQRHLANDTHHCPHGRPTTLLFSKHDLDRQFRRI